MERKIRRAARQPGRDGVERLAQGRISDGGSSPGDPDSRNSAPSRSSGLRPGEQGLPRWLHVLALIAALAAGVLAFPLLSHAVPTAGSAAPDFALKDIAGANQRLSEFQGEVVVLTFWASWCGPCREALASLGNLSPEEGGERPVVIGVNLDGETDRAASVARSIGVRFHTLVDTEQRVGRLYDVSRLPLTMLLDRDGVIREIWSREPPPAVELRPGIRELLRQ
jgi:peroxiredoxin